MHDGLVLILHPFPSLKDQEAFCVPGDLLPRRSDVVKDRVRQSELDRYVRQYDRVRVGLAGQADVALMILQ